MSPGAALVLAALTLSPSPAPAACAWVLWAHAQRAAPTGLAPLWEPLGASPTHEGCQDRRQYLLTRPAPGDRVEGGVFISPFGTRVVLLCLPEHLDPRRPAS